MHASLIGLVGVAGSCRTASVMAGKFFQTVNAVFMPLLAKQDSIACYKGMKYWQSFGHSWPRVVWELMCSYVTKMRVSTHCTQTCTCCACCACCCWRIQANAIPSVNCSKHNLGAALLDYVCSMQKSSLCPLLREYMEPDSQCCYVQDYTGYPCL